MTTLHLGVLDMPYAYDQDVLGKDGKPLKKKKQVVKSITTAEVAQKLEDEYHIMELFYETHEVQGLITGAIEDSIAGAVESLAQGAPATLDPFAEATQAIDEAFKVFITSQAVERLGTPGTPTKAALKGVSHRRAHPYAKANPRRPSFIDTGLFVDSFMSWID